MNRRAGLLIYPNKTKTFHVLPHSPYHTHFNHPTKSPPKTARMIYYPFNVTYYDSPETVRELAFVYYRFIINLLSVPDCVSYWFLITVLVNRDADIKMLLGF